MVNSVDLDEVANYEPPHQDLQCLQIQLFSSLVLKELTWKLSPYYLHYGSACQAVSVRL